MKLDFGKRVKQAIARIKSLIPEKMDDLFDRAQKHQHEHLMRNLWRRTINEVSAYLTRGIGNKSQFKRQDMTDYNDYYFQLSFVVAGSATGVLAIIFGISSFQAIGIWGPLLCLSGAFAITGGIV